VYKPDARPENRDELTPAEKKRDRAKRRKQQAAMDKHIDRLAGMKGANAKAQKAKALDKLGAKKGVQVVGKQAKAKGKLARSQGATAPNGSALKLQ
jgi:hypothetical protein